MGRKPEGKAEKLFKKFGKNVDNVVSDIKDSENFAKLSINQRVAELNKNRESLGSHFSSVTHNAKSQWQEAKPNFERAGQEFKKALNVFFTNRAYQ